MASRFNDPTIFKDDSCETLATYLKDRINKEATNKFNYTVIKSFRTYDSFNVGNHEYPLLLVFRSSELFEVSKSKKTSNLIIRYCLLLPEMEKIMPLCSWVANEIHNGVNHYYMHYSKSVVIPNNRQVEYQVTDTRSSSFVYHFMNYYFAIRE